MTWDSLASTQKLGFWRWFFQLVTWAAAAFSVLIEKNSSILQVNVFVHVVCRGALLFQVMSWEYCLGSEFCVFHRYYLKNNMETETLCSDEDAQELLRESQISLLQLSTVEVATQLSMRNFELFRNIEPTEYIDDLFKLKSKTSCANLKKFEEVINQETFWVASEILRETNQLKRMKIIKHFIKIALHCRECKNFNSMFAIIR